MSEPHQPADNTPESVMTSGVTNTRIPLRALFIVSNEACERLSFYGMSAVLTLYMTNVLGMDKNHATEVSHLFKGAVYFLPLLGALIADRWLGRYRTILFLSVFYCLGHLALAVFEGTTGGLYLGLALIALGAGGIKPCVSAFMGDQFDANNKPALTKAYSLFYWAINFGSFFAFAVIPWVRDKWGYSWAFGVPGIFMGLALIVFFSGTPTYTKVPPAGSKPGFLAVILHSLLNHGSPGGFWAPARERYGDELVDGTRRTVGVIGIFSVIPVFWALFDQTSTTWVLQGEKLRAITLNLPVIGAWKLDQESIQTLNPIFVMTLIPLVTLAGYPLAKKLGLNPTPLRRMTLGMVLAASSFVACAVLQTRVEAGENMSILWQTIPYLLLTIGEVLFSTTGLEFAFTQAPKSMKSTLMSFWLLTTAVGNFLVAALAALTGRFATGVSLGTMFLVYAGMMAVVAVAFGLIGKRYAAKHGA